MANDNQNELTIPEDGLLTLKEAAVYLGVTDQRVRTILRNDRVEATKNEDGHWRVHVDELDEYERTKGRRRSGAVKYVVPLTEDQVEELAQFANMQGWEDFTIEKRYQYDPEKAKAYREKRKAEQAAAEAEAEEASE